MPKTISALTLRCLFCLTIILVFSSVTDARALTTAADAEFTMFKPDGRINKKVEASIDAILKRDKRSTKPPTLSEVTPLLEYLLVVNDSGKNVHPNKRNEGLGAYWRGVVNKPYKEALRYFYNPDISNEILYPASLRRGYWMEGSDLLTLNKPIWEMIDELGDTPIVLKGVEVEEITPDASSGCYYTYKMNRTVILLRYKGVPMLLSISWQDGKSDTGRKANFLGDYNNWDFVFTSEIGGTASGIGWMSTYMYASTSITLVFPSSDGTTCYSMLKWLKAGWSGLNVVKREHIVNGAERNFEGIKAVLEGERPMSVEELEAISKKYDSYSREAMLAEAEGYSQQLAKLSKNDEILAREEFQAVLADGKYAERLADAELRSLLKVLELKRMLGKPVLGD